MSRLLPILFNSEMVRAILDGRKTVTRRVIKPQPEPEQIYKIGYCIAGDKRNIGKYGFGTNEYGGRILFVKPPCKHGDILYVRETWTFEEGQYYYRADFDSDFLEPCETLSGGYPTYCRNYPGCNGCAVGKQRIIWHPSIHMPKEAARIWLRVTDVRVERLQDITEEQAEQEGSGNLFLEDVAFGREDKYPQIIENGYEGCIKKQFAYLWDSTVKKSDLTLYGWDANPWVWVIDFEQCEKPNIII